MLEMTEELKVAIEAVRKAALIARRIQTELAYSAIRKGDRSPVTVADFTVQAIVAHYLRRFSPQIVLVAEENSDLLRKPEHHDCLQKIIKYVHQAVPDLSAAEIVELIDIGKADPVDRFWTLDPIDGTKGFIRGEQYAVGLALIENGSVQAGILGCPNLRDAVAEDHAGDGTIAVAVSGKGSWCDSIVGTGSFRRLTVSPRNEIRDAILLRSLEASHTNTSIMDRLIEEAEIAGPPVLMDSLAKYVLLASGKGDVLIRLIPQTNPNYKEMIWDQASGVILIEEAGGRVTDLNGEALDFSAGRTLSRNRGVLATNGRYHDSFLEMLKTNSTNSKNGGDGK